MSVVVVVVFFFKQKTAYEMRISDWSSDVCSSDLSVPARKPPRRSPLRCAVSISIPRVKSCCSRVRSIWPAKCSARTGNCRNRLILFGMRQFVSVIFGARLTHRLHDEAPLPENPEQQHTGHRNRDGEQPEADPAQPFGDIATGRGDPGAAHRSEEHTSELQSL